MPRKLKPQLVKEYNHERLGVRVQIFYDRNTFDHFAEYNGETLRHSDIGNIQRQIVAAVESAAELVWLPIIEATEHSPFGRHDPQQFISLEVSRTWIAKMPGGRLRSLTWERGNRGEPRDDNEATRKMKPPDGIRALDWARDFYWPIHELGEFSPPCSRTSRVGGDDRTRYFRYSPDLWVGLLLLRGQIRELRQNLDKLLDPKDGGVILAQLGADSMRGISAGAEVLALPQKATLEE